MKGFRNFCYMKRFKNFVRMASELLIGKVPEWAPGPRQDTSYRQSVHKAQGKLISRLSRIYADCHRWSPNGFPIYGSCFILCRFKRTVECIQTFAKFPKFSIWSRLLPIVLKILWRVYDDYLRMMPSVNRQVEMLSTSDVATLYAFMNLRFKYKKKHGAEWVRTWTQRRKR